MNIGSWILVMRMGDMGYIYFNLVFDKGHKGGRWFPLPSMKIQIPLILMKFKSYVLDTN